MPLTTVLVVVGCQRAPTTTAPVFTGDRPGDLAGTAVRFAEDHVVVGAPHASGVQSAEGLPDPGAVTVLDRRGRLQATLRGEEPHDITGADLAAADLDGDGHIDLVVGSRHADNVGAAYLIEGPLPSGNLRQLADATLWGSQPAGHAGIALDTAGDTDGDGAIDLVVGAHLARGDTSIGVAYIVSTTADGAIEEAAHHRFEADDDAYFLGLGVAAAGDVDGDGLDDVLVGTPRGSHAVHLVLGGTDEGVISDAAAVSFSTGAGVGESAGAGDVDGDGRPDLVLGDYEANDDDGMVAVCTAPLSEALPTMIVAGQAGEKLGFAVATGQLDPDPGDEIALGAPFSARVYLVEDHIEGTLTAADLQALSSDDPDGLFGSAVDLASEGVLVGAFGEADSAGRAYLFETLP